MQIYWSPFYVEVKVERKQTLMEAPINKGQEMLNILVYHTQIDSFVSHRTSEYSAELGLHKNI